MAGTSGSSSGVNLDDMQAQMNQMLETQMRASLIQNKFTMDSSIVKGTSEAKQSAARNSALQH